MDKLRFRIKKNGKYGYIDERGNEVIEPVFDHANVSFSEGLAVVRKAGRSGYINPSGSFAIAPRYTGALWFENGLALVKNDDGQWGYIDPYGTVKIPFQNFDTQPWPFSEGFACIAKNGKQGFINNTGAPAIPAIFDYARNFSEGRAVVRLDGRYAYIDYLGKIVSPGFYDDAGDFLDGAAIVTQNGKDYIIDSNFNVLLDPKFEPCCGFIEGIATAVCQGRLCYVNKANEVINDQMDASAVDPSAELICFSENRAPICLGGKWGYIDKTGRVAIKPFSQSIGAFSEGFAAFANNENRYGFIDAQGEIVITPKFGSITAGRSFRNGVARAKTDAWGYIDKTGNFIWKAPKTVPAQHC